MCVHDHRVPVQKGQTVFRAAQIDEGAIQNVLASIIVFLQNHLERVLAVQHDDENVAALVVIALADIAHMESDFNADCVAIHVRRNIPRDHLQNGKKDVQVVQEVPYFRENAGIALPVGVATSKANPAIVSATK